MFIVFGPMTHLEFLVLSDSFTIERQEFSLNLLNMANTKPLQTCFSGRQTQLETISVIKVTYKGIGFRAIHSIQYLIASIHKLFFILLFDKHMNQWFNFKISVPLVTPNYIGKPYKL